MINKLLNYHLILCRDILHELGIIINYKNKTITWQEVLISMKPLNCFCNQRNLIKQIIDPKYKKNNYLKVKHKNFLLELLQKYKEIFDGTLGKYTGYDYLVNQFYMAVYFLFGICYIIFFLLLFHRTILKKI